MQPSGQSCAETVWFPSPFGVGACAKSIVALHVASVSTCGVRGTPSHANSTHDWVQDPRPLSYLAEKGAVASPDVGVNVRVGIG